MEFQLSYLKILQYDAVKVLHLVCQQIWKTQQWPQDWKRSVFIPIPKKSNDKDYSNYHIITLISHSRKVMLKVIQTRLQQYVNWELTDVQAGFWRGRWTRDQIANMSWIMEKAREFQKNIYFWFIDYSKAFDYVAHNKLWEILRDVNTRPPYLSPENSVCGSRCNRGGTGHGTTDCFQIGKGNMIGCILSSCFYNFYAEYIMWNSGLGEAHARSRLPREISINSDMQMTLLLWQKMKRN